MTNAIAVPVPASNSKRLSKAQKAAILLCLLGEETAGPVFAGLDEAAVRHFVRAMADLGRIGPETVNAVVGEFLDALHQAERSVRGGVKTAHAIVERHVDRSLSARILEELDIESGRDIWARVAALDAGVMAEFVAREHPQSAALILSRLAPEQAGRVVSLLEPEKAHAIALAIRKVADLAPGAVEAVAASLNRSLFAGRAGAPRVKPAERLGSIMDHATGDARDNIIGYLDSRDPEFAEATRRSMFTFADIATRIRKQDVSAVVRSVDRQTLIRALSGAERNAPEAKAFLLSNISSRMAEAITQEITELGAVRRKDADAAQSDMIRGIRALEEAGEIALAREDDE